MKPITEDQDVDPVFLAMLKRFNNDIKKSGILDEVKERRYYVKPSAIKRAEEKARWRRAHR